jgi:hypothetical protein
MFENVRSISLTVASATVIAQHEFVTIDTNGNAVEVTDGIADYCVGIAAEASADGDDVAIPVVLLDGGVCEVIAGAAIAVGDGIVVGDEGRAYPHDQTAGGNAPAGTYEIVGIAKTAAGAAGETLSIVTGHFGTVTLS